LWCLPGVPDSGRYQLRPSHSSKEYSDWLEERGHDLGTASRSIAWTRSTASPGRKERPALSRHTHDSALRPGEAHRAAVSTARPAKATTKRSSPGCAPYNSPRPTRAGTRSRGGPVRRGSSRRCLPARSRGSSDSARSTSSGARHSRPTSIPVARTTGGTGTINGLIESHRHVAGGFRHRKHYELRMLLIGGGLSHPHLRSEDLIQVLKPSGQALTSERRQGRTRKSEAVVFAGSGVSGVDFDLDACDQHRHNATCSHTRGVIADRPLAGATVPKHRCANAAGGRLLCHRSQ
jgi:hypothetical protein